MKTITLKKWEDYVKLIHNSYKEKEPWIFRGQSDQNWRLISSLQRLSTPRVRDIEKELLHKYKSGVHLYNNTQLPKDTLSYLAHMQHHGCPTRLIDFTESAYTAAFFAYEDTDKFISLKEPDFIAIWIINSYWLKEVTRNKLLNDAEFITKINEERIGYEKYKLEIETKIEMGLKDDAKKLEKRFFNVIDQNIVEHFGDFFIDSDHKNNIIYPVKPPTLTERFYNQKGIFLCSSNLDISVMDTLEKEYPDYSNNVSCVLLPKSERENAFTMHMLSWLSTSGTAAIVEFPGVLYRGGAEQKIRKYLIDNNYVDAVIQLPPDLFFGTTIATCIIVLKKSKKDNKTLFIDASTEFVRGGNKNKLSEPNRLKILEAFRIRKDVKYFSKLVDNKTIADNDYNIAVSSYVVGEDKREVVDIAELNIKIAKIVARQNELRTAIDDIVADIERTK